MTSYISKEEALKKAQHYCAYQERSHREVKEKLAQLGWYGDEAEELICELIADNFLNEERYARAFARGHFRMKQWGRQKIRQGLKQQQISDYCIHKAMEEIDETEYQKVFQKLARQKWNSLKKEANHFTKMTKTRNYLQQKGYEFSLINEALKELRSV